MRLIKIVIDLGYVVDADNQDMVDHAKVALYDDVMNAVKHNELNQWIDIVPAENATEADIPGFLLPDEDDKNE